MKDWKKVKLGTLLTESKVESASPDPDKRISVKLNVKGVEKRPLTKGKKGATKYFTRKAGQFIYGKQNLHKGAFGLVPEELDGYESSSDLPAFDVSESCYPEWIYYFFKKGNFYLKLESFAKGVGSKRIQPYQIFDLDIFLPEKEEQRKILNQIDYLESNHDKLLCEIELQETLILQLRQSILQDAIQGKLTEEWRKQNPNIEPASELLKRIKEEKAQLIKEGKIRKEKPLSKIKADKNPFEIPKSWEFCRLIDVSKKIHYGYNASAKQEIKDVRLLRITDIQNNSVIWENVPGCNYSKKDIENYSLNNYDIVIARTGGTLGKSYIVENLNLVSLFASYLIRVVPSINIIPFYLKLFFESPFYWNQLKDASSGSGQPNVSGTKLKELVITLPSIEEQETIVEKLNKLLTNCDELEQEIIVSKTNAEKLMKLVLSKLLGEENNMLANKPTDKKEFKKLSREIKYDNKTTLMELVELLKIHGSLYAEDLWRMSKQFDSKNITESLDKFYEELKVQIEDKKAIKEGAEKGYLELA